MTDNRPAIVVPNLENDGSNWVTYRDRLTLALEGRNLECHLSSATMTASYNKSGQANVEEQTKWNMDNRTAKLMIMNTLPDIIFNKVKGKNSAKATWDAVKAIYEGRTSLILVNLCGKLQTSVCLEGGNLHTHFTKMEEYRQQLAALGSNISDKDFASILQNALPDSYHSVLSNIAAVSESQNKAPTPDIVTKFSFAEFDRPTMKRGLPGSGEALAVDHHKTPHTFGAGAHAPYTNTAYWNHPGARAQWGGMGIAMCSGAVRG